MSRRTAMQRPPRLSVPAFEDDEAATCSARESRAALAGLARPPARSGISYIEDSDVISSVGHESVTNLAARPSYVARGEIITGETPTFSRSPVAVLDSADVSLEPDFAVRYENADAYASTEAFEAVDLHTREEPLVAPDPRSFAVEPSFVGNTALMPASVRTPVASVRPVYRSQMMSVPPPPESWGESPWVMPSVRPSMASIAPRDARSTLQTIAIIGTGLLMLAVVFGAVLFARSDSEEQRMEFSHPVAAAQPLPAAAPVVAPVAAPTMQVITTPAQTVVAPVVPVAPVVKAHATPAATVATPVHATPVAATHAPARTRVDAPKGPTKVTQADLNAGKKTKEEESVEALLKKLGEEQLSR